MSALHDRILRALNASAAGMTDEEMELIIEIEPNTLRPRRRELVMQGKVRDSGLNRSTRSGKPCIVWEACDQDPPPREVRRQDRIAAAAQPFAEACQALAEEYADARDWSVMRVLVEMRHVRALAQALEGVSP